MKKLEIAFTDTSEKVVIDVPYNYIVVKVAEHITDTLYALKEVAASEN